MRNWSLGALFLALIFSPHWLEARHQTCRPSGKVKGKKPPPDYCNEEEDICCIKGKYYTTYKCSPPVSAATKAYLYITGFEKGGDGYKPSKCEHKYYSDDTPVVSLPTGWYSGGRRQRLSPSLLQQRYWRVFCCLESVEGARAGLG
ncbi:hypothetical protein SASPL_108213 [Salvia splendens]|uniref:Uncharacterized protein n=1 Tax=Salvia splendens TaxID=180675 RepID=A0A8X9A786_SALSN|nr:hypothetical protein SASPL_108213 [Salvia splendens]